MLSFSKLRVYVVFVLSEISIIFSKQKIPMLLSPFDNDGLFFKGVIVFHLTEKTYNRLGIPGKKSKEYRSKYGKHSKL